MSGASKKPSGRGITEQQQEFARQYVRLGNASGAYRVAYNCQNMSPAAIRVEACRLLDNPNIALTIQHYRDLADQAFEVQVRDIARELARIAFVDLRDVLDENGNVLSPELWPADAARAIGAVDVCEKYLADGTYVGRVLKLKSASKVAALEMLAKWKRMLFERGEVAADSEFSHLSDEQLEAELEAKKKLLACIGSSSATKVLKKMRKR